MSTFRLLLAAIAAVMVVTAGFVVHTRAQGKGSGRNGEIAFARYDPRIGDTVTYVVNPDGKHLPAILPHVPTSVPHWSPDGTKIAFLMGVQKASGSRQEGIYTANANGSDVHRVTGSPTFDHETDWGSHPPTT